MAESALLEVRDLHAWYGESHVLHGVDFEVRRGEVVTLLGRNGAGKTTTFRMIIGMIRPESGVVTFDGYDVTNLPMYKRARRGMGYLSQEHSIFRQLTVWQNLIAILETLNITRHERIRRANQLLDQFGLSHVKENKASHCSGGEKRKLEIARALVTSPKLILLDEPFSGVDPIAVEDLQREIRRLKEEFGKSVLITDHNVERTLEVCDRALIINDGLKLAEGRPKDIINNPRVREAYLGRTFSGDEFD
jgi:lipopolysaccharide export system ATP-binding protein